MPKTRLPYPKEFREKIIQLASTFITVLLHFYKVHHYNIRTAFS